MAIKKPNYVRKVTLRSTGEETYVYEPPKHLIEAGIVKKLILGGDQRRAYLIAWKQHSIIEDWKKDNTEKFQLLSQDKTFNGLVALYKSSNHFKAVKAESIPDLEINLRFASMRLPLKGEEIYSSIDFDTALELCLGIESEHDQTYSEEIRKSCVVMYSFAIGCGILETNVWRGLGSEIRKRRRSNGADS